MYVNPNRLFSTPSSTSINTHPSDGSHSPSLASSPAQSHRLGHMSESHQSNVVDLSNRFHPYPSFGTTSQASPNRGARMANAELTPRGPRPNRSTRVIDQLTSPAVMSNVLDLDDEIGLLQDYGRAPSDDDQQSPPPSPLPDCLDASATIHEEQTIAIEFHFHLPIQGDPPSSRKRKTGSVDIPKTRVYKSEVDKLTIRWDVSNTNLPSFKLAVIAAIVTNEDKRLAGFVQRIESSGDIHWYGSIHHGGPFAASKNKQLAQPGVFIAWLAACREVANKGRKLTCKLDQKDPRALAKRAAALDGLNDLDNPGPSGEPAFQPSSAAIDRAKINEYIGQILATYTPRPQLSGSLDKSVFVNPEKTQEYFVISMRVSEAWGKAMRLLICGPGPRHQCSPTSLALSILTCELRPRSPSSQLSRPAPGTHGVPPSGIPNPDPNHVQAATNTQPDSSPAPSENEGDDNITPFLTYARVDPNSSAVRDGLAELGITHWSMFRHVEASELMTAGVPMGPARTIVVAAKHYSDRLKSRALLNISLISFLLAQSINSIIFLNSIPLTSLIATGFLETMEMVLNICHISFFLGQSINSFVFLNRLPLISLMATAFLA
ncbi:hypothetical protein PGTUg99_006663 [Puccinia graminis f. sp. tritici]|uniref:SAM domain-containing protein n=1 Tax=Puccinia graminis f. sp. tritici TaxID=56615 RepID=A0A5B0LZU2_PUCGR|nr:hypothetical protein PGTUg99_006663 [Puccinia graminis f. sp. tritici]